MALRRRDCSSYSCVLDEQQKQLLDETNCASPCHAKYLGSMCPVVEVQSPIRYDAEGRELSSRLSGLLTFVACYVSSTPTRNILFLGGTERMCLAAIACLAIGSGTLPYLLGHRLARTLSRGGMGIRRRRSRTEMGRLWMKTIRILILLVQLRL